MAWMAVTAGLWREPVKVRWRPEMAEVRITVVGCGSLHLSAAETKQLIADLDSALAEAEAGGLDDDAIEAAAEQRARLMLIVNEAG